MPGDALVFDASFSCDIQNIYDRNKDNGLYDRMYYR